MIVKFIKVYVKPGHMSAFLTAQEVFNRALTIARRDGDETLEVQTLARAAHLAYSQLRHDEALRWSLTAIELARHIDNPLAEVMARAAPWFPNWAFIAITIIAVGNTGLINYITASRLLYGMARDGQLPPRLGLIHPVRRTPHIAVYLIFALVVALVLLGDISQLAGATVLLMLLVFAVVNTALVVLKLKPGEPKGSFEIPMIVPVLGVVVCLALLFVRLSSGDWVPPVIGAVLLLGVAVLYFVVRPQGVREAPPNV